MSDKLELNKLLPETKGFPVSEKISVIRGLTLAKTSKWWKAIVLVKLDGKKQIRLYGWQLDKNGKYKVRQKFNISKGYSSKLGRILFAFSLN